MFFYGSNVYPRQTIAKRLLDKSVENNEQKKISQETPVAILKNIPDNPPVGCNYELGNFSFESLLKLAKILLEPVTKDSLNKEIDGQSLGIQREIKTEVINKNTRETLERSRGDNVKKKVYLRDLLSRFLDPDRGITENNRHIGLVSPDGKVIEAAREYYLNRIIMLINLTREIKSDTLKIDVYPYIEINNGITEYNILCLCTRNIGGREEQYKLWSGKFFGTNEPTRFGEPVTNINVLDENTGGLRPIKFANEAEAFTLYQEILELIKENPQISPPNLEDNSNIRLSFNNDIPDTSFSSKFFQIFSRTTVNIKQKKIGTNNHYISVANEDKIIDKLNKLIIPPAPPPRYTVINRLINQIEGMFDSCQQDADKRLIACNTKFYITEHTKNIMKYYQDILNNLNTTIKDIKGFSYVQKKNITNSVGELVTLDKKSIESILRQKLQKIREELHKYKLGEEHKKSKQEIINNDLNQNISHCIQQEVQEIEEEIQWFKKDVLGKIHQIQNLLLDLRNNITSKQQKSGVIFNPQSSFELSSVANLGVLNPILDKNKEYSSNFRNQSIYVKEKLTTKMEKFNNSTIQPLLKKLKEMSKSLIFNPIAYQDSNVCIGSEESENIGIEENLFKSSLEELQVKFENTCNEANIDGEAAEIKTSDSGNKNVLAEEPIQQDFVDFEILGNNIRYIIMPTSSSGYLCLLNAALQQYKINPEELRERLPNKNTLERVKKPLSDKDENEINQGNIGQSEFSNEEVNRQFILQALLNKEMFIKQLKILSPLSESETDEEYLANLKGQVKAIYVEKNDASGLIAAIDKAQSIDDIAEVLLNYIANPQSLQENFGDKTWLNNNFPREIAEKDEEYLRRIKQEVASNLPELANTDLINVINNASSIDKINNLLEIFNQEQPNRKCYLDFIIVGGIIAQVFKKSIALITPLGAKGKKFSYTIINKEGKLLPLNKSDEILSDKDLNDQAWKIIQEHKADLIYNKDGHHFEYLKPAPSNIINISKL